MAPTRIDAWRRKAGQEQRFPARMTRFPPFRERSLHGLKDVATSDHGDRPIGAGVVDAISGAGTCDGGPAGRRARVDGAVFDLSSGPGGLRSTRHDKSL